MIQKFKTVEEYNNYTNDGNDLKSGITYPTGNNGIPSGWTVVEI